MDGSVDVTFKKPRGRPPKSATHQQDPDTSASASTSAEPSKKRKSKGKKAAGDLEREASPDIPVPPEYDPTLFPGASEGDQTDDENDEENDNDDDSGTLPNISVVIPKSVPTVSTGTSGKTAKGAALSKKNPRSDAPGGSHAPLDADQGRADAEFALQEMEAQMRADRQAECDRPESEEHDDAPDQEQEATARAAAAEKGRENRKSLLESGKGARKTSRPGPLHKQYRQESQQVEEHRAEISDSDTEPSEDDEDGERPAKKTKGALSKDTARASKTSKSTKASSSKTVEKEKPTKRRKRRIGYGWTTKREGDKHVIWYDYVLDEWTGKTLHLPRKEADKVRQENAKLPSKKRRKDSGVA